MTKTAKYLTRAGWKLQDGGLWRSPYSGRDLTENEAAQIELLFSRTPFAPIQAV